ncbi:Transposon TX1 uncharacterized 149 kDa, partial [Paramuricea clavata]
MLVNVQPGQDGQMGKHYARLSYGIPNEAIADALKPYDKFIQIKMDSFHGVYVGVRQVQTCFWCHQTGHMTKDCPNHARTTGNIINADGPLTTVNRASTSTVPDERIGAHGTGNPPSSCKDSDNSDDEDEFVDVLEELPLPEGEGGQQPVSIVLGNRTREPDDSDVFDIPEKRVDRNPDEVDPISMDHDANGVAIPFERTTSVQRNVHTPSIDLGTPSIEAYEEGDEEDGGNDNMETSMAKDNEYPNIPENGSEFSTAQENDTRTTPSTQIPPNLSRKENLDSESPSPIDLITFAVPETHSISEEEFSSWLDHATSSGCNKFGYKCISSPGTILSCGVAILYNPSYDVVSCSRDQDGRILCAEFSKDVYKSSFLSLTAWWDAGKARLKQYIREFSKKKAVSRRKLITSLEHTLFHLNRRLLNGDEMLPIIEDVKRELEAAHRDEARGARIRANVQWAEEGEASTKYFFGLERKRGQSRIFTSVKNMAGTVVSAFVGIARAWMGFYGLLFTSQSLDRIEQGSFLNSLSLKLSRAEQSLCEGDEEHWMPWLL